MWPARANGAQTPSGLRREVDRLFDQFFQGAPGFWTPAPGNVFPAINVWEDEDRLCVEAELPGLKMAEVEVLVVDDELTLKGTRRATADENTAFHRRERGTGEFSRVLRLPCGVDTGKVEAVLRNGVLTVTLPKAPEAKPRRIEVRTT